MEKLYNTIIDSFGLSEPRRIKKELEKQFIYFEHFGKKLSEISGFENPEIRLLLEAGRTPSIDEFVVNVFLEEQRSSLKRFYFRDDLTVGECKPQILEEFKVDDSYSLWDLDMLGNACV